VSTKYVENGVVTLVSNDMQTVQTRSQHRFVRSGNQNTSSYYMPAIYSDSVLLRTYELHPYISKPKNYSNRSIIVELRCPNPGAEVICRLPEPSHDCPPSPMAVACPSGFDVSLEEVSSVPVRKPCGQCRGILANLPEFVSKAGWSQ